MDESYASRVARRAVWKNGDVLQGTGSQRYLPTHLPTYIRTPHPGGAQADRRVQCADPYDAAGSPTNLRQNGGARDLLGSSRNRAAVTGLVEQHLECPRGRLPL